MLTPAPAVSEPREPEWGMRSVSPVSQSAGGHQHASIKHQTEHIEDFIYKIFFVHISNRECIYLGTPHRRQQVCKKNLKSI